MNRFAPTVSPASTLLATLALFVASAFTFSSTALAAEVRMNSSWQDNATNAGRDSDRIGALRLSTELSAEQRLALGPDFTFLYGAQLAAESWPRFTGLDRAEAGPTLALRRKFGLGALAPTLTLAACGTLSAARESDRAGPAGNLSLAYAQRLDEANRLVARVELSRLDAHTALFARTGTEATVEFAHDLDTHWRVSLAARWRAGTVLAYATPPRPDLVALARTRAPSTTFDRSFVAYSLDAHSVALAASLSRALSENVSLNLSYEWRETTRTPLTYLNRLVSLGVAYQF